MFDDLEQLYQAALCKEALSDAMNKQADSNAPAEEARALLEQALAEYGRLGAVSDMERARLK